LLIVLAQRDEALHGESGFAENVPEGSRTNFFVIRHDHASKRIGTAKDYVASFLALPDEANPPETSVGSFTNGSRS
jgi:hypothetical protein